MKTLKNKYVLIGCISIVLAHFFISLGRTETLFQLLTQRWYYADLFFVTIIASVIMITVYGLNQKISAQLPLKSNLKKRLVVQFLLAVIVTSILCFLLTIVYFTFILDQKLSDTSFLIYELPIAIVVIAFINIVLLFVESINTENHVTPIQAGPSNHTILVPSGHQTLSLPVDQIIMITRKGNYCYILTAEGREYMKPEPLSVLFEELGDAKKFYRANRQYIVSRSICKSYSINRSGKLELTLDLDDNPKITISQRRARDFKVWLASNNTSVLHT